MKSCLITKQGQVIENLPGGMHDHICRQLLGTSLKKFLTKESGVRVKAGINRGEIAIEYYGKLSSPQYQIIYRIFSENDYYTLVLPSQIVYKLRPIRNFNFS